jgi:hypothetical protein
VHDGLIDRADLLPHSQSATRLASERPKDPITRGNRKTAPAFFSPERLH